MSSQRYLVLQLARFGDIVQSKRLLYTLLQRGEVHICLDASLAPIASLLYPEAILHTIPVHTAPQCSAVDAIFHTVQDLGKLRFDEIYNCNYSQLNLSLTRFFPQDCVRGYRMLGPQEWRDAWVRLVFHLTKERTLTPVNLVDFWAHFTSLPLPPEDVCCPVRQGGAGIGVVLAGRESRRSLPPEVLAQCLHTVFEAAHPRKIFLLGTASEKAAASRLMRLVPPSLLPHMENLCGKTSWQDLYNILKTLDSIFTPDTGTMHLAAHLGVPVKAFFLSSAWCHETGPYGAGHSVWQATMACAPCLESAACPRQTACGAPFTHKDLLRSLVADVCDTAPPPLPEGLTLYHSGLDAMGARFTAVSGNDPYAAKRHLLRMRIAEFLHSPLERTTQDDALLAGLDATHATALTSRLYDAFPWMLEDVYAR